MQRLTRRGFVTGAIAAGAGLAGWTWLRTRPREDGIPWPLRRVLEWNERLARAAFRDNGLAPTFPSDTAEEPRVNGRIGLAGEEGKPLSLSVRGIGGREMSLSPDDLRKLPRVEHVTELKCVEGWSTVVRWSGVRLRDLADRYRLGGAYVGLETPDRGYYVGLDAASALHPQTLLCDEMNGAPLTPAHGAPLRLVIPVKYGIKNLKQIGTVLFTDDRPADYWAERGYDWYAGL
jgi:DMSO/TMAO reductase YedYZ molybdopterin-dependent catalytic subunit